MTMGSQKAPTVKSTIRSSPRGGNQNKTSTFVNEPAVEITLANYRHSQVLSIKQAEVLAKKLMKLVNEHKVREVMES